MLRIISVRSVRFIGVLGAAACLAWLVRSAPGQNALGGGTALDRNLNTLSGGVNPLSPAPDFRSRNLLITGNVVGGRGFRGSVGYTAPMDFRDSLGSNDLYQFRADAALSSPELFRLGSTYERLRFGQDLGILEYARSGSGATPTTIEQPSGLPRADGLVISQAQAIDTRVRADRASLATSTPFTLALASEPRLIGMTYSKEGTPLVYNASNVRGLTIERMDQQGSVIGLTSFDLARVREDVERGAKPRGLGQPFDTRFEQTLSDAARVDAAADAARVDASITGDYRRVLERIVERYGGAPEGAADIDPRLLRDLDREYQTLREQLRGSVDRDASLAGAVRMPGGESEIERGLAAGPDRIGMVPGVRDPLTAAPGQRPQPDSPERGAEKDTKGTEPGAAPNLAEPVIDPLQPGAAQPAPDERSPAGVYTAPARSLAEFGVILRHGERIQRLSADGQDRFNELMRAGEQALQDGDYFTAERRFERALRFTPGHPLAIVGTAHAQIGAGLYLSSAVTLRNLYTLHPEMIDVHYAEHLLPPRERLEASVRAIQQRMDDPTDRAGYAFAMAYIGRQTGQRNLIERGLAVLDEAEGDDPLAKLLREVWLGGPAPPSPER